jgi:glycine oxidase
VAGGGLIGCAIAWRLAQRGAGVHVIESARPGMAASWAAAGMLAAMLETDHVPMRTLAARSSARFPAFVQELHEASGIDAELLLTGKLDIAFSENELTALRARYGSSLPDGVHELSRDAARDLEPAIADDASGALFSEHDASVDNRKLARAAWVAATNAGVEFTSGSSVREVLCSRNGFEAAMLSTGERLGADAVVVCAGAWSSAIRGLPQRLPVVPIRGQMLALEQLPRALHRMVMTSDCYIVPRTDGRVLVGATVERAGFDPRTTAHGIAELLVAALRVVPALRDATLVETWAGLRPGTSDDLPILGHDPRASGVYYATGHFRNGILLAPITADVMAALVMGDVPPADITAFSVGRFHG